MRTVTVARLDLPFSQAYLVRGDRPVLVDAGMARDARRVIDWLKFQGVVPADLAAIVVTHAHADHAGAVATLARASGAPVIVGEDDFPALVEGGTDASRRGTLAAIARRLGLAQTYPSLPGGTSVHVVTAALRLEAWGVPGLVVPTPGHTPGSVALLLDDGRAFAGDLLVGGYLLGRLFKFRPVAHLVHADRPRNRASLVHLLDAGATVLHVGHGGPLAVPDVRAWLARSPKG